MWEILFLLGVALSVMACGVLPVLFRIRGENNPSPWAYSTNDVLDERITDVAATQSPIFVNTPNIPEFNVQHVNVAIPEFVEMKPSIPDEELWNSVEELLASTTTTIFNDEAQENYVSIFEDKHDDFVAELPEELVMEDFPSVPSLTPAQYKAICTNYGERVASIITCTPYQGCLGPQIMIGKYCENGNRLEFDNDWVELKNEFNGKIDGEVIIVKGNFLTDGSFYVQHWEDPMMIDAGYSTFNEPVYQVK
ncbi:MULTISPECIES: hypothetical protein [unclassified Sporosarcina]|uniref:hypothetical protein n=1 Tax=unclassified Sporosarcina TaxID=2647733 RepID=UPI001A916405|nr:MULTISPECIES: hypothetical protein [unclassified Sporosarcina]MBO0588156.1 hypothetical protein [Sporosarcina sp. E16_8]MBO0601911.1 hypothetical protein [Sporosarcina sp. E16_3]